MRQQKFRFKKEFYQISGIFNIPGIIICNGFGSDLKTYCCKNCGEIFVIDIESFLTIQKTITSMFCPKCNVGLENNLINYPENIFYNGKLLENKNPIDRLNFENTELIEVYSLTDIQ